MPVYPEFAERFPLLDGVTTFEEFTSDPQYADRFQRWADWPGAQPPDVPTDDKQIDGPHGPIPIRIYGEATDAGAPALVWYHGGGFMMGGLDMAEADWTARELAVRATAVVVSVDYRLARDGVHHPVPLDDCVAAARWVRDNAGDLGVDPARIHLGGGSAGANLAAAATLRVRDEDQWLPAGLLPVYGMFHPQLPPMPTRVAQLQQELPPATRFPPETVAGVNVNYLGGPPSLADGYAMPGLANLEGLCTVTVINAEYDALRVSGEAFAAALVLAGVDTTVVTVPGMLHAFLNLPARVEPVGDALNLMASVIAG